MSVIIWNRLVLKIVLRIWGLKSWNYISHVWVGLLLNDFISHNWVSFLSSFSRDVHICVPIAEFPATIHHRSITHNVITVTTTLSMSLGGTVSCLEKINGTLDLIGGRNDGYSPCLLGCYLCTTEQNGLWNGVLKCAVSFWQLVYFFTSQSEVDFGIAHIVCIDFWLILN